MDEPRANSASTNDQQSAGDQRREEYLEMLRETPYWDVPIEAIRDENGDWVLTARLSDTLQKECGHNGPLAVEGRSCWDTAQEAREHLEENDERLREELCDDLFTMGACTAYGQVVPVLGDYVPYSPNGELRCSGCMGGDDGAGAPGIVREAP